MRPSRQEILDNFKRECPAEILKAYTNEGLNMMLDNIEEAERVDDEEFEVTPLDLNCDYSEVSLVECLELFELQVDLTNCQNETERQAAMKDTIKKYLEPREAFIGFTSAHHVIFHADVDELEAWEYAEEIKDMYG